MMYRMRVIMKKAILWMIGVGVLLILSGCISFNH
jgi:hypothetical protein